MKLPYRFIRIQSQLLRWQHSLFSCQNEGLFRSSLLDNTWK